MRTRVQHLSGIKPSVILAHRGFSIVELMVAVAVGLIGILAIMQAYSTNEGIKRSTTGVGMSQANGAIALYTLERDIRMGGYGFVQKDALNCSSAASIQWYYGTAYSATTTVGGALAPIKLAPILIQDGGAAPDTITVTYGTDEKALIPTVVGNAPATGQIQVVANYGFDTNDLFLIAQPNACKLYNVTAPVAGDPANIIRIVADSVVGPFNPPNPAAYTPYVSNTSAAMNLGQLVVNKYDINGSDLRVTPMFSNIGVVGQLPVYNNQPQIIGNDIVDLKAYYGKDTTQTFTNPPLRIPGTATALTWNKTPPINADEWAQVRVVKVALLARSGNYEKPDVAGVCNATVAGSVSLTFNDPTISSAAGNATFNSIPQGLPSCYRYRAFETTIPVRNLIWRN